MQREQEHRIEVFCEKGSYRCDLTKPYQLEINCWEKGTWIRKPTDKDSFMQYVLPEGQSMNFHTDAHLCCLVDFAKKVYDGSDSGWGADFQEAYLSQCMTEDGMEDK